MHPDTQFGLILFGPFLLLCVGLMLTVRSQTLKEIEQ